jgi:hypothetical protein
MKKHGKLQKKGFCSTDLLRKGHEYIENPVHWSQHFFSSKNTAGLMDIILSRIQKYILTLVAKSITR